VTSKNFLQKNIW